MLTQSIGEKARISAAGGFVDFGRVNGNLALSRALGDFEFKRGADLSPEQQIVTAYPDVTTHEITDDDEFLVIACDGKPPAIIYLGLLASHEFAPSRFFSLKNRLSNPELLRHMGLSIISGRNRIR